MRLSPKEADEILGVADSEKSGLVNLKEFCELLTSQQQARRKRGRKKRKKGVSGDSHRPERIKEENKENEESSQQESTNTLTN